MTLTDEVELKDWGTSLEFYFAIAPASVEFQTPASLRSYYSPAMISQLVPCRVRHP